MPYDLSFDGDGDWVKGNFQPLESTFQNSFTMSAWVKPFNGQNGEQRTLGILGTWASSIINVAIQANGKVTFTYSADGNSGMASTADVIFPTGQSEWRHILATADSSVGGAGGLQIYIDGAHATLGTSGGDGSSGSTSGITFGDFAAPTNCYVQGGALNNDYEYSGSMRDLSVWSTKLTDSQITDVFKGNPTSTDQELWWKLDDNNATVQDSTSNNRDGTVTNSTWSHSEYNLNQIGVGSVSGTAIVSGGTWNLLNSTHTALNGTNGRYDLGDSNNVITGTNVTYATWIRCTDGATNRAYVITNQKAAGSTNMSLAINRDASGLNAGYIAGLLWDGSSHVYAVYDAGINDGEWHQIVYTTTGSSQVLYLDGVQVATSAATFVNAASTDDMTIGAFNDGTSDFFSGDIGEVIIDDVAWTPAQVELHYKSQWVGNPAHWMKFIKGTGNEEDSGRGSLTVQQAGGATWVKPNYDISNVGATSDEGLTITSGTALSAPQGELLLRAASAAGDPPNWRIDGKYIHNSGTLTFSGTTTTDWYPANKADNTNTYYKVKQAGTKPQWHNGSWTIEHSLNLQGNIRSYANSSHANGHTLTLGTTGSVGYISGSAYIQAMTNTNGGSLIKSASENYPAVLSGTHASYGAIVSPYRSIQVSGVHMFGDCKTGNNGFENGSTLKILGNTVWGDKSGGGAEIRIPLTDSASNDTGQNFDVSGASVHIKIPMYISGNMIVKDAAVFANKFMQSANRSFVHNDNSKIIYSHQTANNDTFIMPAISGQQMMNSNYRQFTNAAYDIEGDLIVGRTNTTGFRLNHNFNCRNIYVGDDANSVFDQNDKTLTVSGTKLSAVGGFIGACQGMFDNTASQRITISDNLDEMATSNNFTVEAWFEASDDANYRGIFSRGSSWGTGNIYMYQNSDGYVQVSAHDLGKTLTSQTIGLADGKWHHAAATYDQTSFKLYIDGILEVESAHTDAINTQTGGSFIGSRGTSDYFNGSLVRVSAWDTALTQSQIQQMMFMDYLSVSSSAIDHTKCVSWFQFDGKTNNTTVYNLAANGTDGTAATTALWDVPNGYSNWIKGTGSTAQLYLTSPLDIDVWGKNWRIGNVSGGATAGKKMKITRWDGYEQTIMFYGAWKWGPGTLEQTNYSTYGDNATPWCTANGNLAYVEEISGTPFGHASNGLGAYWNSNYPTKPMTIKNMLPTDSINLGGDLTIVGTMMPSLTSKSKYIDSHGWDMNLKQWKSYGGTVGELRLRGGSTLNWVNSNNGFSEGVSNNSLLQIVASGENAASFNQFSDKNNWPSNYNYIDTNATIVGTGSPAAFTVSFWYKSPTDIASYTRTMTTAIGFNSGNEGGISLIGSNWLVLCHGNNFRYFNSAPNTDGLWHHMLVYVDPADAFNTRMWVDGSEESANSTTDTGTTNWSGDTYFGYGDYGAMPISLADIRFYNAANTPTGSVATLAAINPATSETLSYADPSNALNAYAWFKLDSNNLGTLSLADTVGTYNSAALTKAGSAPDPKSCYVKMLPSGSTNAWEFNIGTGDKMLQNFYLSGSSGDILVSNSGTTNDAGAYYPGSLTTKGKVRFD